MSIISNSCTFVKEKIKFDENFCRLLIFKIIISKRHFEYELLMKVTKTGGGVHLFPV